MGARAARSLFDFHRLRIGVACGVVSLYPLSRRTEAIPMKHWLTFGIVILTVSGAIVWSEVHKVEAPVGPDPILNLLADGERELTRLPVAFAPLADSEEIKIG